MFLVLVFSLFFASSGETKERKAEVTFKVSVKVPSGAQDVRLWLPYPVSDENQTIEEVKVDGNFSQNGIYREKKFGNLALYSRWEKLNEEAKLSFSFKVTRKEVTKKDFSQKETTIPLEVKDFLAPSSLGPIDGKIKEIAEEATKGKKMTFSKARSLYDYLIDNFARDPAIKGCGPGNVLSLLEAKKGKCADLHSVYVCLAKSVGVPAREIMGIRIPKGAEGNMTGAYHCWAEVYIPGYGWIPIDPSDVRKIILDKKIEKLEEAKEYREYYFGAIDENRIQFGTGRDLTLSPEQKAGSLNYFMYPYVEIDGKTLDWLAQEDLKYEITFKEF
ncbi:MAG TPA: transglutaminase [Elusimicrobia bacterium]|nr:transglutaminase [Elusimicrobiota bacterium]